jgi:hypothetical protein
MYLSIKKYFKKQYLPQSQSYAHLYMLVAGGHPTKLLSLELD